jgi:hypothetical protein
MTSSSSSTLRCHYTVILPSFGHRVMPPPVPLRTPCHRPKLHTDAGSSLDHLAGAPDCSSAQPLPVPHQPQALQWTALVSPPPTPLSPQISLPVLLRALAVGPTNLVAGRRWNSAGPPSTGAMGASSPALSLRPTCHVGWAVTSRAGRASL